MKKIRKEKVRCSVMFIKVILLLFVALIFTACANDKDDKGKDENCKEIVQGHPGYEVWAGNTPYFQKPNHGDYFSSIDKYGYTLIGSSTITQTFNTGDFTYYVIVAKYYNCIDAIQFNDNSYYGTGGQYTLYTELTDYSDITGAPDGVCGRFGWKEWCPSGTYNGFITDDKSITSRGKGLKVIVGNCDCQSRTDIPQ